MPSTTSSEKKYDLRAPIDEEIIIIDGEARLQGHLNLPEQSLGLVLFAHGSGSGRFSPRNNQVAQFLNQKKVGTLLFDLLTDEESENRDNVFDIPFLATRLKNVTEWINQRPGGDQLALGYFGASTGAGAALWAASELGNRISAIVSRGGRPDLALTKLMYVKVPTLLLVGGEDESVIEMNQTALQLLPQGKLIIISGATHLFEEKGALESVAYYASEWFTTHLTRISTTSPLDKKIA
jgi:putative phosphoribosyl transferase